MAEEEQVAASESPVTRFLSLLTKEWVAYSSEGVSLRASVQDIARIHGAEAEIAVQADGALLTVVENDRPETITVVSGQEITRLDRFTDLKHVLEAAKDPDADLDSLSAEVNAIAASPPIYAEWMKALGIVLFSVGFSVTVQGTWQEVGFAALTAVAVALIVVAGDRIQRVSVLTPLLAAVMVSLIVLVLADPADLDGGAILLMVPALFFFIPGDILSASMFELAAGRITSGSAQFVYSIFTLLLLYLGVVFGAALTGVSGTELFGQAVQSEFPAIVPWLGWVLFAFGFMMAFSVRMRNYGWVLLVTLVAFGATQLGTAVAGEVLGTYLGAVAMVVVAAAVARDPNRPPLMVVALSGFFVLTVGALGLEGFTALVSGDAVAGFTDLLKMLTIGMAIALGLLTGAVLVRRAAE
jgi:uncharacterized membrane protein YjjP (DUF1212 family)